MRCSHCGQEIIRSDDLTLPRIKKRIFDAVRRRPGIDSKTLRELVWADDPNGGPEDRKAIHVHVNQLNKLLSKHGLAVRGHQTNGYIVRHKGNSVNLQGSNKNEI